MINVYSLCPGGTGKKIKFCCPNRVEDFRKIYKYLEAEQHTACLNYIDRLLNTDSERSCLLAIRCVVLKFFPAREQDLISTANRFYELHPENPIAIAESAQAILLNGQRTVAEYFNALPAEQRVSTRQQEREARQNVLRETVERYQEAFTPDLQFMYEQVIFKLETIAKALIKAELYESALSWIGLVLNLDISPSFKELFTNTLHQLKSNKAVPLCFRTGLKVMYAAENTDENAAENTAWKSAFNEIVDSSMLNLNWKKAVEQFKALETKFPEMQNAPEFWYNMALVHEWLCNIPAAKKYWEKYLTCKNIPFYDALEKQIRLSFFSGIPLEDEMEICTINFPLDETAPVFEKMQSEPTFRQVTDLKLQPTADGTPLAAFDLLDSPKIATLEGVEVEDIPVVVGNGIIWESQEGQKPHLSVINVMRGGADFVEESIRTVLNPWISGESKVTVTRTISVTLDSILRKIALPDETSNEKFREIRNEHCRSILLNRWIHFPLGILKGLSMKKAASRPEMRLRVETVMYVLYHLLEMEKFNTEMLTEVRGTLGLAPLPELNSKEVETLSPIFYSLLKPGMLTSQALERVFFLARMHSENNIPRSVLETEMNNPLFSPEVRVEIIKALWCMDPEVPEAFALIEKGRNVCNQNQISDVFFDIMEVAHYMNEGKFQSVFEALKHIQQAHSDDSEAIQYVTQLTQYMYGMFRNNENSSSVSSAASRNAAQFPSMRGGGAMQSPQEIFQNALNLQMSKDAESAIQAGNEKVNH